VIDMIRSTAALTACLAMLLFSGARPEAPAQTPGAQAPGQGGELTIRNRFDAVLSYRTPAGETRRVRVARRQWSLAPGANLPRSPESGLLLVQVTGGDATLTIGRERRSPRGDDFWTVPPGTPFRIDVGREQATLEVLAVAQP
jgi:hypothetical protein